MFTKILVPLDGSPLAERALPHAARLARITGARLLLVRAALARSFPGKDMTEAQCRAVREAATYLQRVADSLAGRGFAVETAVPYGEAASRIAEEVELRGADLIVMATHGRSGIGRWLYGSVAAKLLAHATAPVLLVRAWEQEPQPDPIGDGRPRVVIPLDGSPFAEEALPVARKLVRALDGELVLLQAIGVADPSVPPEVMLDAFVERDLARNTSAAQDYLGHLADPLIREGYPVRIEVGVGAPADVIAAFARNARAKLLVLATHGRTGAGRAFLGSVADAVLRRGNIPLLLVRPRARDGLATQPPAARDHDTAPGPKISLDLDQDEVVLLQRSLQTFAQTIGTPPEPGQLPERIDRLSTRLALEAVAAGAAPAGER